MVIKHECIAKFDKFLLLNKLFDCEKLAKEKHLIYFLTKLLGTISTPDKAFIDIGSYKGEYAVAALKYASAVLLLEPHPRHYRYLVKRFAHQHAKVLVLPYAIIRDGYFKLCLRGSASSVVRKCRDYVIVRGLSINRLFAYVRNFKVIVVKMDIEGAELETLRNLKLELVPRKQRLIFIIELHGTKNRVLLPLILTLKGFTIRLLDYSHILAYFSRV